MEMECFLKLCCFVIFDVMSKMSVREESVWVVRACVCIKRESVCVHTCMCVVYACMLVYVCVKRD